MRISYRSAWLLAGMAVPLMVLVPRLGAQAQKDVLTDQQTEGLRAHAGEPEEKLKLFLDYIGQRTAALHQLSSDREAPNRSYGIHDRYQEFTELCDELQDNMDAYNEQHADLRKALKLIVEKSNQWAAALNEPESNSDYDFARKIALEARQSITDAAKQMMDQQTKYFEEQKKEAKKEAKAGGS